MEQKTSLSLRVTLSWAMRMSAMERFVCLRRAFTASLALVAIGKGMEKGISSAKIQKRGLWIVRPLPQMWRGLDMLMLRIREVRACLFSMASREKTGRINKNLGRREGSWGGKTYSGGTREPKWLVSSWSGSLRYRPRTFFRLVLVQCGTK